MTVIAYRDGVMAADSGSFSSGTVHGFARKLARGPDGTLYGGLGNAPEVARFLAWVDGGCEGHPPDAYRTDRENGDSSFCILRARPGAGPELVTAYGVEPYVGAPYMAVGAAREAALGALHAGAGAEDAVRAAVEHSQWAHGPVRSISHEG